MNTYWKSNPYLTKTFTGEDDSIYPQWVIIDLANNHQVNAIRIAWAEPYARRYVVQYWTGEDPIKQATKGTWVTFPGGTVSSGSGGSAVLKLSAVSHAVRFLRILMTESSNTCDTHGSADRRNCVGYAIREIYLGNGFCRTESFTTWSATPPILIRPQPYVLRSIPGTNLPTSARSATRWASTSSTPAATPADFRR